MRTVFTKAFSKDLQKLKNNAVKKRVAKKIIEIEKVGSLSNLTAIKKIQGSEDHYRIRVSSYRIGIKEKDGVIIPMRLLHRKDIYRKFP